MGVGDVEGSHEGKKKLHANSPFHQVRETQIDILEGKGIMDTRKVNIWKSRQD